MRPSVQKWGYCRSCGRLARLQNLGDCRKCYVDLHGKQKLIERHGVMLTYQDCSRESRERQERVDYYARSLEETGAIDWKGGAR